VTGDADLDQLMTSLQVSIAGRALWSRIRTIMFWVWGLTELMRWVANPDPLWLKLTNEIAFALWIICWMLWTESRIAAVEKGVGLLASALGKGRV
jgi:hypothetical protein